METISNWDAKSITTVGILSGMPDSIYHSISTAVSASSLKRLAASTPLHLRHALDNVTSSPAMTIGSALHCSVLQCDDYENQFVVLPDGLDRRTKEGKLQYDAAVAKASLTNAKVLTFDQDQLVIAMTDAIIRNASATSILQLCPNREVSIFGDINDCYAKARIDLFSEKGALIADIKTTSSLASAGDFGKSVATFGYGLQAAFYRRMLRQKDANPTQFIFIVVESQPPHGVSVFRLVESQMDLFDTQIDPLIDKWVECQATGVWCGWQDKIVDLVLPKWVEELARETQIDAMVEMGGAL